MPRDFPRARRVAEQILRELPEIVRLEVRDPAVRGVTFTEVEVARDLEHARVYYTTLGEPEARTACQAGLDRAAGFLRSQLAQRLLLRTVPRLNFVFDTSVERGAQLSRLIDTALAEDARHPKEP